MKRALPPWRGLLAACAAAWLLTRVPGWSALQALFGIPLVFLLPGLAVLRLLGLHERSRLWLLLASGALSLPVLGAAAGLAARVSGARPDALGIPVLLLCAVVLAWPDRAGRDDAPDLPAEARPARDEGWILALALALAGVVALGFLNPRLAQWSDAWFHAAVFNEVVRAGVPPQYPHFAGEGLPYPWFFHLCLASCRRVVSGDPFLLMALVNLWTALLWGVGIHLLARAAGLTPRAARWSALAGVVGVNPIGSVLALLRSFTGATHGLAVLRASLANANCTMCELAFHFPCFQSGLLSRLWTPTAFNFALVMVALVVLAWLEAWERPRPRALLLFLLSLALLLHWHTLTALHLAVGIAAGTLLGLLARARRDLPGGLLRAVAIGAAAGLACLLARPYLDSVTLGVPSGSMMTPRLVRLNAGGLVFSMGPVALAALIGAWSLAPGRRAPLIGLALGLLVAFLTFDLPGAAEEKLYYPLFVVLAALSGAGIVALLDRGLPGRAAVAVVLLGGLLTAALTAWGFLGDSRPIRDLFSQQPERAALFTRDEAAALRWVRERSPREAVFLQHRRPNGPEPILVYGERRMFLGPAEAFYRAAFFPKGDEPPAPPAAWRELLHREALQAAVYSERALAPDTLAMLRRYPWPLYAWWDDELEAGRLSPTLRDTSVARVVFASPTVRVLEVRGGR